MSDIEILTAEIEAVREDIARMRAPESFDAKALWHLRASLSSLVKARGEVMYQTLVTSDLRRRFDAVDKEGN